MHTGRMKVVGRSITALAIGVALTVGSASLASASSHHDNGNKNRDVASAKVSPFDYANIGRGGYVMAVNATSMTVETWSNVITNYTLTPTTKYTEGKSPSTWASLVVGDRVNVQTSPSDPTTALSVNIELAELFGRVTALGTGSITIMGPQGFSRTIVVGLTTTYTAGGAPVTLASVAVGSKIFAQGTIDANSTSLDAVSIEIGNAGNMETIHGVVTGFTTSSVTVLSKGATSTTFTFTTTTTFKGDGLTLSAADLAIGQKVGVEVNSAAATTALNVHIELAHLEGKVTAVVGISSITISGPQGFARTVDVSSTTTYFEHGVAVTFAAVVVGARIRAVGTIAADQTSLNAIRVVIQHPRVVTPKLEQKGGHGDHGSGGGGSSGRGHHRK